MGKYRKLGVSMDRKYRNDLNANFDDLDTDLKTQKKRVDDLITGVEQPSEVVDARGGMPVLRDRLNNIDAQISQNARKLEKSADLYSKFQWKLRNEQPVTISCMGTSMTYGTDTTSDDKRAASTLPADDGSVHTATRASTTYPEALLEYLTDVYGSIVNVVNKGFSGDGTKKGYEHWNASGADVCIMDYGINDASNANIEYMGDVETYLYWYRKLIQRELDNGTAVILLTPTKQRVASPGDTDARTDVDVFANAAKMLAAEYNLPCIDGHELLKNYSSDIYSDYTHLNGKGYRTLGARIASIFIGEGAYNPHFVSDGAFLGVRPQIDNVNVKGASIVSNAGYPTPNEGAVGQGLAALIKNGDKIFWSFYCSEDSTVIIPSLYTADGTPSINLELDFNTEQAQWSNTWSYFQDTTTDHNYREPSIISLGKSDLVALNGTAYNSAVVKTTSQKVLKVVGKGWHTVSLSVVLTTSTASATIHGLDFYSLNSYRNKVFTKLPLTLTNGTTAFDSDRTPYLLISSDKQAKLIGTINTAPVSSTTTFATIDQKYAPKQNMVFVVALSSSSGGGYGTVLLTASGNLYLVFVSVAGATYAGLNGVIWAIGE